MFIHFFEPVHGCVSAFAFFTKIISVEAGVNLSYECSECMFDSLIV